MPKKQRQQVVPVLESPVRDGEANAAGNGEDEDDMPPLEYIGAGATTTPGRTGGRTGGRTPSNRWVSPWGIVDPFCLIFQI